MAAGPGSTSLELEESPAALPAKPVRRRTVSEVSLSVSSSAAAGPLGNAGATAGAVGVGTCEMPGERLESGPTPARCAVLFAVRDAAGNGAGASAAAAPDEVEATAAATPV